MSHQPWLVFIRVPYLGRIGIWSVGFCRERKTGESGEKPWSKPRANNKLHPLMTPSRNRTQATLKIGELPVNIFNRN